MTDAVGPWLLVPCPACDGAGEWDEGPLPASSGATEPNYRQVICSECGGEGVTFLLGEECSRSTMSRSNLPK